MTVVWGGAGGVVVVVANALEKKNNTQENRLVSFKVLRRALKH